jgi:hypothetical protein
MILLGYGNVRKSQGRLDESFTLHMRALVQYEATVGQLHYHTGDACIHVADHYVRSKRYDDAM